MDNLQIVESLNEAIRLLVAARMQACGGSLTLWRIVSHAEHHLDSQIAALLAPDPDLAPAGPDEVES